MRGSLIATSSVGQRFSPEAFAQMVAQDICSGVYLTGERYLSVRELARKYTVSAGTAHQGVRQLCEERLLEVRGRSGTFIGPGIAGKGLQVKYVHCVVCHKWEPTARFLSDGFPEGLTGALTGVSLQIHILPDDKPVQYVSKLYGNNGNKSPVIVGTVLNKVPREILKFFSDRQLPAVYFGDPQGDIKIPSMNRDQYKLGRLAASLLLDKGHKRLDLLMAEQWYPGDNRIIEAIEDEIAARGNGSISLRVQSVPHDSPDIMRGWINKMLSRDNRPTALICRRLSVSVEALKIARDMGLRIPEDIAIFNAGRDKIIEGIEPQITGVADEDGWHRGKHAGEMLMRIRRGEKLDGYHWNIPIKVIERGST